MTTASGKKFALSLPSSPDMIDCGNHGQGNSTQSSKSLEMIGNRMMSCEAVAKAVEKVGALCPCGFPLVLDESFACRRGLVSRMALCCKKCSNKAYISDS